VTPAAPTIILVARWAEIAFFCGWQVKTGDADGGPVQVTAMHLMLAGSWGSSGTIIFAATRVSPIFRVPADGGTPVGNRQAKPASERAEFVTSLGHNCCPRRTLLLR